nr:hypothetical protein [Tanacetum cinerariifolium]
MATTIEQQVALDEAFVPSTQTNSGLQPREMLHICPRIPGQAFAELPLEEEILEFIRLTAAAKGKQPAIVKNPSDPSEVARIEAQQLNIVLRRSRQQTHISQLGGSDNDDQDQEVAKHDDKDDTEESEEVD